MKLPTRYALTGALAVTALALGFSLWTPSPATQADYAPRYRDITGQPVYGFAGAEQSYLSERMNVRTGEVSPADRTEAAELIRKRDRRRAASLGLNFTAMGPDNQGGRTRAILVDRNNSDRIFVGGVSGGLFVSEDGSGTWTQLEDFANNALSSAIIASMAQAPNGDIYVGTGSNFDAVANVAAILFPGKGIFVSRDGGNSFQSLASTFPTNLNTTGEVWNTVNRIAIDQSTGRIYAATNRGLQLSDDDGETWINPVYLDPGQTIPATGICHDVALATDGTVLTVIGGSTFRSDNGDDKTFSNVTSNGLSSATRVVITFAPSNDDIAYALTSNGGVFGALYRSQDKGRSWTVDLQLESFESGDPMRGQGVYNLALGVSPNNANKVLIGGVELWRWDGNLTRIALEGVNPLDPRYVHADKHVFTWDPNNPNIVYIGSDGGVTKSVNDAASFLTVNKGLITTQFYGISQADFGGQEVVIGGTQDNGTWLLTGENPNDPLFGQQIFGADGMDCNLSQISEIGFITWQSSNLLRGGINPPFAAICPELAGNPPFRTISTLWENANDLTSKDSLLFEALPVETAVGVGNDVRRTFSGTVSPTQPSGIVVNNTLRVRAGQVELNNSADDNVLAGTGGSGTVTYNNDGSILVNVTFADPPTTNLIVRASFDVRYEANSTLELVSATAELPIQHVLTSNLEPGDAIKVQDPVQSIITLSTSNGFAIAREALNLNATPQCMAFTGLGTPRAIEFTPDGNHIFVGTTNGQVHRISGINQLYEASDIGVVTTQTLAFQTNAIITGIAIDHTNPDRVIVTTGNYGLDNHVFLSQNALSANPSFTSVQGDLPPMPVYEAEIDINDPSIVLLGTEFGVWATDNVNAGAVEWTDENNELMYAPTYDVVQQKLPFGEAVNHGVYYIGTHGRGIWKTGSLVSTGDELAGPGAEVALDDLRVYPNPADDFGTLEFELTNDSRAEISIIDVQGKVVRSLGNRAYVAGVNRVQVNTADLPTGLYFLTVQSENQREVARMVVRH